MQTPMSQPVTAISLSAPRWSVRRTIGVALATLATAMACVIGLQTLFSSGATSCGADCATTFATHRFAVVLGVPAMAWATALHGVLWLTTWGLVLAPRTSLTTLLQTAQLALVIVLLGGSATYLVIGLTTDVRCKVCLAMHALAVVAALGVALTPRANTPAPNVQRAAAAALALAAWLALAWGMAQLSKRAHAAQSAPAASTEKWLGAVCQPSTCPTAAHFGPEALPDDDASIVLGRGVGPTLVAWLDLACGACRADFRAEEPLLRDRLRTGKPTRLVLRASSRACDAQAQGNDPRTCEAPTAVVCAARHAGADAALDLLAWEFQAEPGYYTLADRRQALAAISPMAARCLDSELALGARGTLAAHAEAARRIAVQARSHAGCDSGAWWCFDATPSFVIVHPSRPPTSQAPHTTAFATATGALRKDVLEQCLEPSP